MSTEYASETASCVACGSPVPAQAASCGRCGTLQQVASPAGTPLAAPPPVAANNHHALPPQVGPPPYGHPAPAHQMSYGAYCRGCGIAADPVARFCKACGAPQAPAHPPHPAMWMHAGPPQHSAGLAMLFTVLWPGAGHLYIGNTRTGTGPVIANAIGFLLALTLILLPIAMLIWIVTLLMTVGSITQETEMLNAHRRAQWRPYP